LKIFKSKKIIVKERTLRRCIGVGFWGESHAFTFYHQGERKDGGGDGSATVACSGSEGEKEREIMRECKSERKEGGGGRERQVCERKRE